MNPKTIAVIMGGPSREHDISLKSGEAMLAGLDPQKYQGIKLVITKDGQWLWGEEATVLSAGQALHKMVDQQATALIGLHGSYGEDGTIQALLERYDIPYTGSGVAASLLAMDKTTSNQIYQDHGMLVPTTVVCGDPDKAIASITQEAMKLPVVVKPVRQGSSVGVHIVKTASQLEPAVHDAFLYDQQIMVQTFVKGRELSCGVLERDGQLAALPPTEIIPVVSEFFDYKAKYTKGGSQEITPAKIPPDLAQTVQELAVEAHQALGCKTYSRTDFIAASDGVYVIETNTLPGMTSLSILPAQAQAAGLSFTQLLDAIIAGATQRATNKV